jgi:hypothetical protein
MTTRPSLGRTLKVLFASVLAAAATTTVLAVSGAGAEQTGDAYATGGHSAVAHGSAAAGLNAKQLAFHDGMRKLWEDHITWTRLAIVSFAGDLPDLQATEDRLLANQTDIGDAIKPYYGDAAGNQLAALLQDHITGAAALLMAAKSGDQAKLKTASDAWYANGNAIAAFLNKANPNAWPLATLQDMMKMHRDTTVAEATANLKGDYTADVAGYDAVHEHILHMADALSDGVIAEFPQQFGGPQVVGMPRTGQPASDAWFWLIALIAGNVLLLAGRYLRRKPAA